jgi:hypothetical protein
MLGTIFFTTANIKCCDLSNITFTWVQLLTLLLLCTNHKKSVCYVGTFFNLVLLRASLYTKIKELKMIFLFLIVPLSF